MFEACPKCSHAPLPEIQEFPVACPACGLVLAKFKAVAARLIWQGRTALLLLFSFWGIWIFNDYSSVEGHDRQNIFGDLKLLKLARLSDSLFAKVHDAQ